MKEELIGFRTAKLAKEKGVNLSTDMVFLDSGKLYSLSNFDILQSNGNNIEESI